MGRASSVAAVAVVLLASSGCGSDSDDLRTARDKWEQAEPDAYSYTYRVGGQTLTEARVTVDGDQVTFRVLKGDGEQLTPTSLSMDAVFEYVEQALRDADRVDASYDGSFGYPTLVEVDEATAAVDDEYAFAVRDFTVTRAR